MEMAAIYAALEQELEMILANYQAQLRRSRGGGEKLKAVLQFHLSTNDMYCEAAVEVYRAALAKLRGMRNNREAE
jgi:hypothetical protein